MVHVFMKFEVIDVSSELELITALLHESNITLSFREPVPTCK
jgi:hypothetical protein